MSQIDRPTRPRRSLLFVPGLRPDRFAKALDAGADIVCVDMEDAVALPRKDEGRALALPLFRTQSHPQVEKMARINSLSTVHGLKDLQAIIESDAPPPSIMIPKIKSPEEIQLIETLLSTGPARDIRFCVIIETNQGLERAIEIAKSSSRIDSMILGAVDMSAELRCQKSWEPLLYTRSRLVHAAASAGIDLLDVPYLTLDDPDGLRPRPRAARGWVSPAKRPFIRTRSRSSTKRSRRTRKPSRKPARCAPRSRMTRPGWWSWTAS